jgi:SPP1 family predicted phage head-tail adaptor
MARSAHAGALDRRIEILQPTHTNNAFNEPVPAWSVYRTVWAARSDASAAESYRAREVGAEITTRFTLRWSAAIAVVDPAYGIRFAGRTYNITGVRGLDRRGFVEIDAVARAQGDIVVETEAVPAAALAWGGQAITWGGENITWGA